jgi:nucleoside-diphosphate-sugar epimerase
MPAAAARRRLFCFGLGYSALTFARRLRREGWRVAGTCRGEDKRAALAREGFDVHLFERGRPLGDAHAALSGTTHILSSVPPDDEGDPVLDHHADDIARVDGSGLAWVGYLSTTGVYGDRGGGWVDEATPPQPINARSWHRLEAEEAWLALWRERGVPVHVFRLAGIYGPGRGALEQIRAGTAKRIVKPGQVFSRIHVEDIARTLEASMARPNPGAIYNVCDDEPAPPDEVVAYACELLGVPAPPPVPFDAAALSPMARSFYADNKRVSNRRIKDELGVRLAYPNYREGLRGLLTASGGGQ